MSCSIIDFTTDELKAEIRRREIDAIEDKNKKLEEHHAFVLEHVDLLLKLVPEHDIVHDRTRCSDESPINCSSLRCKRCALLSIKKENWNYDLSVDISFRYEEPQEVPRR
jgi:hypothetical protein